MRNAKRPNILLIYTDQQRWDSLGCYGNNLAKTPNLDRLAAQGARLNHYFVQNPVCMPSRMSFLTSRYCGSLGIGTNGVPLPDDAIPVNQLLKPYGYQTAQIGKLHFRPHARRDHRDPTDTYGFDTFMLSDEPGCYDDAYIKWVERIAPDQVEHVRSSLPPAAAHYGRPTYSDQPRNTHEPYAFAGDEDLTHSAFVTAETSRFIEQQGTRPFFAIAGFYAPHPPVNPPRRFIEMYRPEDMPLPHVGKNETIQPFLSHLSPRQWQEITAYYLALVSHVDDCVGQILQTLDRCGLTDNTMVIFTSDHGEFLGDHGRIQKGMPGHDCITRVPCLIRYPAEIPAGQVIEPLVEAVDIVPTILDFCAVQTPSFVQGQSIRHLLTGTGTAHRPDALTEAFDADGRHRSASLRTDRYRYDCAADGSEWLYDLADDPDELNNVADDPSFGPVVAEMRKRLLVRLQGAAYVRTEKEAEY